MSGENSDVSVVFGANITGIAAGVEEVKAQLEGLAGTTDHVIETFTGVGEAIAAAFAVERIQGFVEHMAEAGVDLGRMEAQLGMTANEVNILSFAAENSDTKMQMLVRAITNFDRVATEASTGTGKASEAFRALNINAEKYLATGHSLNDLFNLTNHRLSEYKDSQEKAAIVSALYGGRSAQLVQVLNTLGSKYGDLSEAVRRSGDTVDGFDKAAEETMAQLVELKGATTGFWEVLFMKLKPALDIIEGGLINFVEGLTQSVGKSQELVLVIDLLIQAFRLLKDTTSMLFSYIEHGFEIMYVSAMRTLEAIQYLATGQVDAAKAAMKNMGNEISIISEQINSEYLVNQAKLKDETKKIWQDLFGGRKFEPPKQEEGGNKLNASMPIDLAARRKAENEDIADHKSMLDRELADDGENLRAKMQHVQAYFDWLKSKYPQNVKAMNDAAKRISEIQNQEIRKEEQSWQRFFGAFNTGLSGMLRGTTTWRGALQNAMLGLADNWIKNIEKIAAKWIATEIVKTSATNAGNAARTASDKAASVASGGFSAATAIKTITGDAAKAYAGTYGFLAPEMGPFAAIPAGVAFAAVMGMEALIPSFAVGTWNVPHDMKAQLHEGERVMTAEENRSYSANGGAGGMIEMHFHGPTDKQYFMQNAHHIAAALGTAHRNFNPHIAKAAKS